jgi:hypothetical protein
MVPLSFSGGWFTGWAILAGGHLLLSGRVRVCGKVVGHGHFDESRGGIRN